MEKSLQTQAETRLRKVLQKTQRIPALRKAGPKAPWTVDVSMVGPTVMKRLNQHYRGKDYVTDVLSFGAPLKFRAQGYLGELVICGSVLKRQARERKHKPELELEILLVHGVLHLLGFDHELGARAALVMTKWESKLLGRSAARGLISRIGSGI
jgi:probable rRNA maturation factor